MHLTFTLCYFQTIILLGVSGSIFGTDCKMHVNNRHVELKDLITSSQRFNWHNWSHLILLIILGFLLCFLFLAYCFIKIKIWPVVKHTHTPSALIQHQRNSHPVDKPFIIQMRDQLASTAARSEVNDE